MNGSAGTKGSSRVTLPPQTIHLTRWAAAAGRRGCLVGHPFSSSLLPLPSAGSCLQAGPEQGRSQLYIATLVPLLNLLSKGVRLRQSFLMCNGWMNTWMANQPLTCMSL